MVGEPVGADNLFALTRGLGQPAGGVLAEITAEDVIAGMPVEMQRKVRAAIGTLPAGFRLAPALYSRIDPKRDRPEGTTAGKKSWLRSDYSQRAKGPMYRLLARDFATQMKRAGFDDHAIAAMAEGQRPISAKGETYKVNIDHIIEQGGSGAYGKERTVDPRASEVMGREVRTAPVNHLDNLILIRMDDHEHKNRIMAPQTAGIRPGETRLVVMMVPDRAKIGPMPACISRPVAATADIAAAPPTRERTARTDRQSRRKARRKERRTPTAPARAPARKPGMGG